MVGSDSLFFTQASIQCGYCLAWQNLQAKRDFPNIATVFFIETHLPGCPQEDNSGTHREFQPECFEIYASRNNLTVTQKVAHNVPSI
jgi:hypothetical protein